MKSIKTCWIWGFLVTCALILPAPRLHASADDPAPPPKPPTVITPVAAVEGDQTVPFGGSIDLDASASVADPPDAIEWVVKQAPGLKPRLRITFDERGRGVYLSVKRAEPGVYVLLVKARSKSAGDADADPIIVTVAAAPEPSPTPIPQPVVIDPAKPTPPVTPTPGPPVTPAGYSGHLNAILVWDSDRDEPSTTLIRASNLGPRADGTKGVLEAENNAAWFVLTRKQSSPTYDKLTATTPAPAVYFLDDQGLKRGVLPITSVITPPDVVAKVKAIRAGGN